MVQNRKGSAREQEKPASSLSTRLLRGSAHRRKLLHGAFWVLLVLSVPLTVQALSSTDTLSSDSSEPDVHVDASTEATTKSSHSISVDGHDVSDDDAAQETTENIPNDSAQNSANSSIDIRVNGQKVEVPQNIQKEVETSDGSSRTSLNLHVHSSAQGSEEEPDNDMRIRVREKSSSDISDESDVDIDIKGETQ